MVITTKAFWLKYIACGVWRYNWKIIVIISETLDVVPVKLPGAELQNTASPEASICVISAEDKVWPWFMVRLSWHTE
jgi:hypothetical protein